jgi:hypothetical protein
MNEHLQEIIEAVQSAEESLREAEEHLGFITQEGAEALNFREVLNFSLVAINTMRKEFRKIGE